MRPNATRPEAESIAWLCFGLTLAMAPHWMRLPAWVALLCLACVGWRLGVAFRDWMNPGAVTRLALTLLSVVGTWVYFGTVLGRGPGIALLVQMLSLKLLEINSMRDAFLIACLSYFVIASQFLFNQDPLIAAYMAFVVVVITMTLMVLQDQNGTVERRIFARQSGAMLLQAVPLMCVLFVFFPRLGSPLWGLPESSMAKVGLSNEMSPGSIISLFVDDTPAFRASFDGPLPPAQELYWRGPVLWRYDGTTWTQYGVPAQQPRLAGITDTVDYRVILEPHHRRWLFALDMPMRAPPGSVRTSEFELVSRRPITELRTYTMRSATDYVATPQLSSFARRAGLQLPTGFNPRTRALGDAIAVAARNPREAVQITLAYFREQPFIYSLSPPPLGRNAMDDFIFETRNGYCEHYASAFTVIMRATGIPARVVTGYLGGSYNRVGNYMLVRQSDAHAWSEVWIEGAGWIRVDPTAALPLERIEVDGFGAQGSDGGNGNWRWLTTLYMGMDALKNSWNQWLLTYDRDTQVSLFANFGADADSWYDNAWLLGSGSLIAVSLGMLIALLRTRRYPSDPVLRAWRRYLARLERAGMPVAASDGPTILAKRASRQWPGHAGAIGRITRAFIALRYQAKTSPHTLSRLQRELHALSLPRINETDQTS